MAVYLKEFETQAAYEAAQSGLIPPNVSLITDNNTMYYNPSSPVPPTPTYESVDLGLSSGTLWAKYNIGATSETEYGNYYQYGKGVAQYAATSGNSDYSGTESPLAISADTAAQVWGGQWHTPTSVQCQELLDSTTKEWVTDFNGSGIKGTKFIAQNGNYIFIPASGGYNAGTLYYVGTYGAIWASTPKENNRAYYLYCDYMGSNIVDNLTYNRGVQVRAVIG